MLRCGDPVWVKGYVRQGQDKVDVYSYGVILENQINRKNTILVRLEKFNGEHNVDKRVLIKFITKLN